MARRVIYELLFGFKRIYQTGLRHYQALVRDNGLTPARLDVLRLLADHGWSQASLASSLGIASSTLSRMLASMEEQGLVERAPSPFDRRVRMIRIPRYLETWVRELLEQLRPVLSAGVAYASLGVAPTPRSWIDAAFEHETWMERMRLTLGDRAERWAFPLLERYH